MDLADEFRARAERSLKYAREAPTVESQTHWLSMAQLWHNLAHDADEQDAHLRDGAMAEILRRGEGHESDA